MLTQKSCIFMQTKCKKCIIKILMHPRTKDVDLKNSLHLLWILNRFCCLSDVKIFRIKRIHMVAAILDLTTQRGLEKIYTSGKLECASAMFVCCLIDCACWVPNKLQVPVIWQWTVKREEDNQFFDKWLKKRYAWHWLPCGTKFLREFIFAGWWFFVFCGN